MGRWGDISFSLFCILFLDAQLQQLPVAMRIKTTTANTCMIMAVVKWNLPGCKSVSLHSPL